MYHYEATETDDKDRTDRKILATQVAGEIPLRFLRFLPPRECRHVVYSLSFWSSQKAPAPRQARFGSRESR
jgi:hypothetical protein